MPPRPTTSSLPSLPTSLPSLPAQGGSRRKDDLSLSPGSTSICYVTLGTPLPLSGPEISPPGLSGEVIAGGVHLYQVLLTRAAQDPRHLQYVADVNESNVYVVTQGRKLYGMPTDFGFCVKVKTWPGLTPGLGKQELLRTLDPA